MAVRESKHPVRGIGACEGYSKGWKVHIPTKEESKLNELRNREKKKRNKINRHKMDHIRRVKLRELNEKRKKIYDNMKKNGCSDDEIVAKLKKVNS